jgi:hypothetical protein
MKHIICCGCLFTRQYKRFNLDGTESDFLEDSISQYKWPHYLSKKLLNKIII